jgi:hypothetical protein
MILLVIPAKAGIPARIRHCQMSWDHRAGANCPRQFAALSGGQGDLLDLRRGDGLSGPS